ncbi:glycoside hydrolase family 3 protein [Stereum hirsutum FP-91666 SS1]|uniref:glycoside hydrolase family 3 protein n=1 Tax=Stereum hirsutum (strain FP-91666) TaxID=721885 RepID=UPI000444A771|nr:glycoside hydrolase family 3 protein [Stereum hirsutum FP-91666 SS1]EIM85301.1 glycoside hydrolase family 3 protein [Stereum hirsutum FP-91666 SS1]
MLQPLSSLLFLAIVVGALNEDLSGVRDDLHFHLNARATNKDGSTPVYKDPTAAIEDRVNDLLPRMTIQEKMAQIIQGDMNGWMNFTDPLDDTLTYNASGLVDMMDTKAGTIWGGYLAPWDKFVYGVNVGQHYLIENTTLGIPAMFQSEGLHGFTNNGTIWPSPIGLSASFNTELLQKAAATISDEAEGLGFSQIFAPVLDLSRELRWGRVEENFGEDPFLTGEMGHAYVTGLQSGQRRNVSSTATARMASTCKHFAAFGSPQGGLNIAQVTGGERELRSMYLKPFNRACVESLAIMTAYSSYDGIPAIANTHIMTDILRDEWSYQYWAMTDAGSVDLLITTHGTCETRECAAATTVENIQGEMGGGTYTYLTLPDQVSAGTVNISFIDETVKTVLRTKLTMGLFENPYPYADYNATLRTSSTRALLHQMEQESIVLLENHDNVLPLSTGLSSVALIGPQVDRVSLGDYVFFNASNNGISPLEGFTQFLANTSVKINFAQGCELWSNDQSGFDEAVSAAQASEVVVVMVGTWTLDQTLLWTPGTNATTGEHVDLSDLGLVGAQLDLIKAIKATGKPTVVVLVSGKPVAEPWIQENADAVIQQFYPGELGGLALAEIIFGAANPSGKLPVSFPRSVGTTPVFYNYLKGSRPIDAGVQTDNGTLVFGHQYVLNSPVPIWSFGHGMSYTTFNYSDLTLSSSTIGTSDDFNVSVTVTNSGPVDGKEVIQVYLTDVVSSVVTPNQELVGFSKVDIPAGQSQTVSIPVLSSQLAVWTVKNTWAVEPGTFVVKVGTSDETFLSTNLTVS